MILLPTDRTISIANGWCAYCSRPLTARTRTRDHLLARRFVPQGTLLNSFNIGLWACGNCNTRKSRLEDDISAITMQPNVDGIYARDDDRLRRTAERKARGSISADTGIHVARSRPKLNVNLPFGLASTNIEFTGAARIDDARAEQLAWLQVQGIFYFQTFRRELGRGRLLQRQNFHMACIASRADWGNPRMRAFMSAATAEPQFHATLADGYFRAWLRARADGLLAWAVEWNESYRCVGFWGDPAVCQAAIAALPELEVEFVAGDTTNGLAFRIETALPDDEDDLFEPPPEMALATIPATPHWT